MAILNRFLRLLELLEQTSQLMEELTTPMGLALGICLFSYQALWIGGCDSSSAAILASAIALALHCGLCNPEA
ncbi:hypothetical protein C7271_20305 [filamentous cyanobacterium CCP5]|nr:hypothetical protein C7271_20305 [filamentous cyanobacterium CCP5]